jgi:uncharacterized protein YbjT (DUF2867 family)
VTRDGKKAAALQQSGAEVAVANIRDVASIREVFRIGRRAFLLNPPADPSGDTDAEERANVNAIIEALEGSGLEKVVAASTYGARPGERCGDLTVLHELEEKLRAQSIPAAVNRGAYYMSNWAGMLELASESGKLPSFFPDDLALPMVAPDDLGKAAAERLLSPVGDIELRHVEGPQRYTPADVANAIGNSLGLSVDLEVVPREAWHSTFLQFGFSDEAAASYACMTAAVIDGEGFQPENAAHGTTGLGEYFDTLKR